MLNSFVYAILNFFDRQTNRPTKKATIEAPSRSLKTRACGRILFRTGIPNIFVAVIEDHEPFIENRKLRAMETDESKLLEAEIRGTMYSIELSTDVLYQDINLRICEAQRQQIVTSQALLKQNMENMRDTKGRTLASHVAGEVAMIQRCNLRPVKLRRGETRCCRELPIWHGKEFEKQGFMKPVTCEITGICTPRVCNQFSSPLFNIGSQSDQIWIKIDGEEVRMTSRPQEFIPESHNKAEQIVTKEADIFTDQQKAEFEVFTLVENTRKLLTEEIVNHMYTPEVLSGLSEDVETRETPNAFISYNLQKAFLPLPISLIKIVPDWVILIVIGIIGLLLIRVFFDPVMACCTLISDSSLSLTQKLSSVIIPATAITWMSKKRNQGVDASNIDDFEMRVSDLENQMSWFKTVFIVDNDANTQARRRLEPIEHKK